jgi:lipopolysaccharide transport system permease protein
MTDIEEIKDEQWDLVIKPKRGVLDINIKELWHYRDLIILFVKRDFVAQYKQTILGPLWHLIQPVLTTVVFVLVFGRIARISTDGIPPILFYITGITLWNYFSTCLTATSNTFVGNASIFGKVYFPRLVMPLSITLSNLIKLGIQFLLVITVMVYYHFNGFPLQPNPYWLLLPFLIVLLAGIGLGLGIIISSLTTKYRDISVLLTFAVQLGMYATPIAYPFSFLKDKSYGHLIALNPLTAVVESFRFALFHQGTDDLAALGYSIGFMVVVLIGGILLFNKVESSFMDTV